MERRILEFIASDIRFRRRRVTMGLEEDVVPAAGDKLNFFS